VRARSTFIVVTAAAAAGLRPCSAVGHASRDSCRRCYACRCCRLTGC
jgi:hypothetical protein